VLLFACLWFATALFVEAEDFYWEEPQFLVQSGVSFPTTLSNGELLVAAWQRTETVGENTQRTTISLMSTRDGTEWVRNEGAFGPFEYVGRPYSVYTMALDSQGAIYLAISTPNDNTIRIYSSVDDGRTFSEVGSLTSLTTTIVPRLFIRPDDSLVLFVSQESVPQDGADTTELRLESLVINYALSPDGSEWSDFTPLVADPALQLNFLPHYAASGGRDYVAFQVFRTGNPATYQIYLKYSDDGCRTWSAPIHITTFEENGIGAENFDNQRPFLVSMEPGTTSAMEPMVTVTEEARRLALTWERRQGLARPQVYYTELYADGRPVMEPERVTDGTASMCREPRIVVYEGTVYVVWFDNRNGDDHVFIAEKRRIYWEDNDLSYVEGSSSFGRAVVLSGSLYVLWLNQLQETGKLVFLEPDTTVSPPEVRAANFPAGEPARQDLFETRWTPPRDSSGIAGFSFVWDRDPDGRPPERLMVLQDVRTAQTNVDEDGPWYFHVSALDYAGNWSEPATITAVRDTTPPGMVEFPEYQADEGGYLPSNTAVLSWEPPEEDDVAGYAYRFQYLARETFAWEGEPAETFTFLTPPARIGTDEPETSFFNMDNGTWALTVAAIDTVGNMGPSETTVFKLNKYIPVTYITNIDTRVDDIGVVTMRLIGRGFSEGGLVTDVILDRDGREPFDYIYPRSSDLFTVTSDRIISSLRIQDIDEGDYRVGLIHPERGLYFTRTSVAFESSGTVKFGDFSAGIDLSWTPARSVRYRISFNMLTLGALALLLGALFLFTLQRTIALAGEGRRLERDVRLLLSGDLPVEKKEERLLAMKRRGIGLRLKFVSMMTMLVLIVVASISVALGMYMITTQQRSLASGLRQSTEVLLESLSAAARDYLPVQDTLSLGLLPSQSSAMEDAEYITILGAGINDPDHHDYVWASNDAHINEKTGDETIVPGVSRMDTELTGRIEMLKTEINRTAATEVSAFTDEIKKLGEEAREAASRYARSGADEDNQLVQRLSERIKELDDTVVDRLTRIGDIIESIPPFDTENFDLSVTSYTFYKPIVYASTQDDVYFRGLIIIGVSTERILAEIDSSRQFLLMLSGGIGLAAVLMGIVGALILAAFIIRPINALVRGVETIRDTEDKEELKSHSINVRTRDELSLLAETVNQMTQGLVKAAAASKDLTVGKEVQKMFIPLETNAEGRKLSTGSETTDSIDFFGYYEGAKGVSGDYFNWRKLDDEYFAVIMCDVAGKGVPASLIMVEVATIFLNYFKGWRADTTGIHIDQLLYSINDLLDEVGFKGRFAAMMVVILNQRTGMCHLCHAGANIVHLYSVAEGKMITRELEESPASGVFPTFMLEMKAGYRQVPLQLQKGDTLFLFTDGVEEAQRTFRDTDFNRIICQEPGLEQGQLHDTHPVGNDNEELGIARIHEVINSVYGRRRYVLKRYHNPIPDEELVFDFTGCEGNVEEAIMAMVSVEKVFRICPDPAAGATNRIQMDRKIDAFLKERFVQYSQYFAHPLDGNEESEYIYFSHLTEDEQYDDLTVLGVKKL